MKRVIIYSFLTLAALYFINSCGEKKEPVMTGDKAAMELVKILDSVYDKGAEIGVDSTVSLVVKIREEFNKKYEKELADPAFKELFEKTINENKKALEEKATKLYEQRQEQQAVIIDSSKAPVEEPQEKGKQKAK